MKPSLVDTDILSEFLRGNPKIIEKVEEYLNEYDSINLSIITYYEILNGLSLPVVGVLTDQTYKVNTDFNWSVRTPTMEKKFHTGYAVCFHYKPDFLRC